MLLAISQIVKTADRTNIAASAIDGGRLAPKRY